MNIRVDTPSGVPEGLESSVQGVSGLVPHVGEAGDAYPHVVAMLDPKTRLIAADIQWIIQRRLGNGKRPWQGVYYCRSKAGLLHCMECRDMMDVPVPPKLLALPDWFPEAA